MQLGKAPDSPLRSPIIAFEPRGWLLRFAFSVLQPSPVPARLSRACPSAPPAAPADPPSQEAVELYAVGALVAASACRQCDDSAVMIKRRKCPDRESDSIGPNRGISRQRNGLEAGPESTVAAWIVRCDKTFRAGTKHLASKIPNCALEVTSS